MNDHRLNPILNLVGYCHDFLKGARNEAKGRLHLRRGAARQGYLDLATIITTETLFFGEAGELIVRPTQQAKVELLLDDISTEFEDSESISSNVKIAELSTNKHNQEKTPFDILRRLYGLVKGNPHELECIYGILFLEGNDVNGKPVLAPLITAPTSIRYDSERDVIKIECEHDYARLNTFAISELLPDDYDAMEETLRGFAQLPLPLDYGSVRKILRTLQTLSGRVYVPTDLVDQDSQLSILECQKIVSKLFPPGHFCLQRYAALAVVRRGNVFVLDDLSQMAKLDPKDFEDSLVARFVLTEEGSKSNDKEKRYSFLGKGEILFPFAANNRQIEVAHSIEHHGLIRVQGPPGTGKSQTIANLVCHLVARRKKVLVASQQQKAVEVVENYLEKLCIDFLPMTLLKGDREAIARLKNRLDGLAAFTFGRPVEELLGQGQEAERKVAKLKQKILDLEAELSRSLVFETTPWAATGKKPGELAAEYAVYREYDRMAEKETVSWGQQAEVIALLEQAVAITRELDGQRLNLIQLCESADLPDDSEIEALLQDILSIKDALEEEAHICPRSKIDEIRNLSFFPNRSTCTPEEVEELKEKLARQILRLNSLIDNESAKLTIAATTNHDKDECIADLDSLDELLKNLPQLSKLEEDAASCIEAGVQAEELAEAVEIVEAARTSRIKWLFPSVWKSRRIVAAALGRRSLTRTTDISSVRARVEAHRLRKQLSEKRARRLSHLPIPEIPTHLDTVNVKHLVNLCSGVKDALQARSNAYELSILIAKTLAHEVNPDVFLNNDSITNIYEQIGQIQRALKAEIVGRKAKILVDKWSLSTRGGTLEILAKTVETGDFKKAQFIVSSLDSLLPLVPKYRSLLTLLTNQLKSWNRTAQVLIRKAEEENADLSKEIISQVYARALRTELTAVDRAAPRDPSVITEESRQAEELYRKASREAVEAYFHSQIVQAYANPSIGNEVRYFSKILQKGKRNYEAFLNLKRSPKTFEAVLSILPCWVATIQDVARVFPLRSHLFDIVIIDEASQCSIPSALPLFLRSEKAIVVGDDKQLPCVDGKFVSKAYNEELINQYRLLETLPRPESFNACESSLFDLAGSFTEKPIFLAEHFRCHPDIIAFSNKRFYDERLIILTHGMDQSLGAPTEVILVEGATDDPQAKVNYKEAEAVVRKLRELVTDPRYEGMDFGVCSPFRNQADFIWEMIIKEFTDKEIEDYKLVSATADGFQGDERDIILYSFRFAPNSSPLIFTLVHGSEGQKRMNVAITRPRRRALCFISHSIENFPQGLIRDFLRHVSNYKTTFLPSEPWESKFEQDVHNFLESKGLDVRPQVPA
jgi:hypothetical protein